MPRVPAEVPDASGGRPTEPYDSPDVTPAAVWVGLGLVATLAGLAVRTQLARVGLWLDEAQSVAIAELGPAEMIDALRADGHPPLYYLLLHVWMSVVGNGDGSLRLLSAIFGVAAVLGVGAVARRVAGPSVAIVAVGLAATNPYFVRYATEVRMYSLVTALACVWYLLVERADERPTLGRLVPLAATVGVLSLTHYWSLFLFAAWAVALVAQRRLGADGSGRRLLAAHVVGGLAFLVWVPSLLHQMAHTGTPWSGAPNPASVAVSGVADLAGGREEGAALALMLLFVIGALIGVGGRPSGPHRIEIDLLGRPDMRRFGWLVVGPMAIATLAITLTDTAFASRYLAVIVGFALIVIARGVVQLGAIAGGALLVGMLALGLVGSWRAVDDPRSQGRQVAEAIAAASPTDTPVVIACPDQVGPASTRYLPEGADARSYPLLAPAGRVDWTDYADRHAVADPVAVAEQLVTEAAGAPIWMVWQEGYRTLEGQCSTLRAALAERTSTTTDVVAPDADVFEPMWLTRFDGPRP